MINNQTEEDFDDDNEDLYNKHEKKKLSKVTIENVRWIGEYLKY